MTIRPWLVIPVAFFAGFILTPQPHPAPQHPSDPPPIPTTSAEERRPQKPPVGISKPISLNDINPSKRLASLLRIYGQTNVRRVPTLDGEQERFRLLAELDSSDTSRLLSDLWNLKADPANPLTIRDLGLPADTLLSIATANLERDLIERLIDLDRQTAWDLASLRSQSRALAINLKHLRRLLPPAELLTKLISLRHDLARETHRAYLAQPEADGSIIMPLLPAEKLSTLLTPDTLRWFHNEALIVLEELIESSLGIHTGPDPRLAASRLSDVLGSLRKSGLGADAWESIAHDLIRRLHRISDQQMPTRTDEFFRTLSSQGFRPLVDAYRGTADTDTETDRDTPSLRSSGAGAFRALTQPSSPLANDPAVLHQWFLTLPEGLYREGFLDAALEQAIKNSKNRLSGPDLLTLGTPEERVAFFIDWFERELLAHDKPLETRSTLLDLHLAADEVAAILNHIAPLRAP